MNVSIMALLGLLWSTAVFGQVHNKVNKLLATKDFIEFEKYNNSLRCAGNLGEGKLGANGQDCLRDLADNFKEGVFFFAELAPNEENPATSYVRTFKVRLVANKDKIIFYDFSERKFQKATSISAAIMGQEWQEYYELISRFEDGEGMRALKKAFRASFGVELMQKDLFVTTFIYGDHCGIGGETPRERQQLNALVARRNIPGLVKWLQSANLEKQVYAVDGFWQLKQAGFSPGKAELKMIRAVLKKKGTLNMCSGCTGGTESISKLTQKFSF